MVVNDHTRSAENWKCVWYLLRLYIYIRMYVDSHSLGQLALASKRTASIRNSSNINTNYNGVKRYDHNVFKCIYYLQAEHPHTGLSQQRSSL